METDKGTGKDEKSEDNLKVEGESVLSQTLVTSRKIHVSVRKKDKYNGEDQVDTYLLNQIAKHVNYGRLGTLARDLNIDKSIYSHIEDQEDKIWEVLSSWKDALPDDYTVNDLITEIQEWHEDDYLYDDVWKRLRKCVSPEVLEGLGNREPLMDTEETPKVELLSNTKVEGTATSKEKRKGLSEIKSPIDPPEGTSLATDQVSTITGTDISSKEITYPLNSLQDEHILELSKRIPTGVELMDLGIKVLHLKEFKIKSALHDHDNSIQAATHELLSTWMKGQTSRQEAYTNLYSDLRKGKMKQLAGQLKQWVEGVQEENKHYSFIFMLITTCQ